MFDADLAPAAPPQATISARHALITWVLAWLIGPVVLATAALAAIGADLDDLSIPDLLAAALCGWSVYLVALGLASRRYGVGDPIADYGLTFRPVDLVGIPVGVVTQLVLLWLLYLPLRELWPQTFSKERLDETATDLVDRADGMMMVLLVAMVVIGAPIVEELVYRGLLQRSVSVPLGRATGLLVVSAWFSVIHLRPVEYPGLFLAGLVFGGCVVVTDRIGPAIIAHAAFNATGLVLAVAAGG